MLFESIDQHSYSQLIYINRLIKNSEILDKKKKIWLAVQLIQHGFPRSRAYIHHILGEIQSNDAQFFLRNLIAQSYLIDGLNDWGKVFKDVNYLKKCYELNGYVYWRGTFQPNKLVIIFTTMFNNFYISNAMLLKLLNSYGVSVLLLKDATHFNYLNGVVGLGENLIEVADSINRFIENEKTDKCYLMGFSSGGYGSLFLSAKIPCQGYLGFSVRTNLHKMEKYSFQNITQKTLNQIPKRFKPDLRDLIEIERSFPKRVLIYGDNAGIDKDQALSMTGCLNVSLVPVSECGHMTVAKYMQQGKFIDTIKNLIA